jgi:hypothetical protein
MNWLILILIMLLVVFPFLSIISWRLRWAIFIPAKKLPPILQGKHSDWWFFFKWIPRRINAFMSSRGEPVQLFGSNPLDHHQDVPAQHSWCLSWPCHLAIRFKNVMIAIGWRFDYVDLYYTLRLVFRRRS